MEVLLLGTGSADGWPDAFCRCASCGRQLADGVLRTPTAVLVDDVLLLDSGPETPRAALRAGRRLDRLEAVLLTHDHPDRGAPATLLARTRAGRTEPLVVAGPAAVLDRWRPWVAPDAPVSWRPTAAGDRLRIGGYEVEALAGGHDRSAVPWLLTAEDRRRLLYATGPLPEEAVAVLAGRRLDVALLGATPGDAAPGGTGHRGLRTFAGDVARLRRIGALDAGSRVVAVRLGHAEPPEEELRRRLAELGASPGRDGEVVVAGRAPADRRRPHRTLVVGGARSGKSTVAERLLAGEPSVTYVATGRPPDVDDPDWSERVRHHRDRRPAHWSTVETTDLAGALTEACGPVLVDCLGTWLTAVLTDAGAWDELEGWEGRAQRQVDDLLRAWRSVAVPVVAVSNEVGSGVVPAHRSGGVFRDWLGRLNQAVASTSERSLLVVAGRVLELP